MVSMSTTAIRAFGILTFVFEAGVFLVLSSQRSRLGPLPWQALISLSALSIAATLIGVGLLFLRKWAAIVFSLALVAFPIWITVASIGESPSGFYLLILAFAIVLILPIIIIIRTWPLLSWSGKWFF